MLFIKWAKKRGVSYKPIWDGITKNRDPCPHGKQILGTPDQTYIRCGLECSEPKAIPWQPGMTSQAQQGPMPSPFLQPSNIPPWIKMMYLETFHHATFKHSIEITIGRHLLVPCCTRPGWHCTMDTGRVKIWSVVNNDLCFGLQNVCAYGSHPFLWNYFIIINWHKHQSIATYQGQGGMYLQNFDMVKIPGGWESSHQVVCLETGQSSASSNRGCSDIQCLDMVVCWKFRW